MTKFTKHFWLSLHKNQSESLESNYRNDVFPFCLVVGDKEMTSSTVNVRTRDNKVHGEKSLDALLARFEQLQETKQDHSEDDF